MNILLLGSGGREMALAWRLSNRQVRPIDRCPGNPGMPLGGVHRDRSMRTAAVRRLARERAIGLIVVGPEGPLVAGVADAREQRVIATFGPSACSCPIGRSKGFSKDLCARAGIPTAD
jgi:phosphoribosylamine--glycine ligase